MATFRVTAEHCGGASVSHPCKGGVYTDPAELLNDDVVRDSEAEAIQYGFTALERLVDDSIPCGCSQQLSPGGRRWWNSLSIHAEQLD